MVTSETSYRAASWVYWMFVKRNLNVPCYLPIIFISLNENLTFFWFTGMCFIIIDNRIFFHIICKFN